MKKMLMVLTVVFALMGIASDSYAIILPYDTEIANLDNPNMLYFNDGRSAYAQFKVDEDYILHDLGSLISSSLASDSDPVYLKLGLYQGSQFYPPDHPNAGLETPDLSQELISYQFSMPVGDVSNYYGLQDVSVPLYNNTPYWVGWEAPNAGTVTDVALIDAKNPFSPSIYRYEGVGFVSDQNRPTSM